jgi:enoyl-CoA hydratase
LHDSLSLTEFADNGDGIPRGQPRAGPPRFAEGVRDDRRQGQRPRWNPATPEGVTDDLIEAIFAPLPANEEWTPLP